MPDKPKLLNVEDALALSRNEIKMMYKNHVNPALGSLLGLVNFDNKYVKAQGIEVWDEKDNTYLDFMGGYGALNLGHNHHAIIEALKKVNQIPSLLPACINPLTAALAAILAQISPGDLQRVFFCNSGAEAIEGALKTARISTGRSKIIYCEGSFHGKTLGALSVTGRAKYQKPFLPLLPECYPVPFGDGTALEEALQKKDAAAFIVEPIQGEGGIIVPPDGYLQEVRQLCSKYGTLLIVDEVQTGFGRTGKMFACEWDEVAPDILCLAKSLGGGIIPIGAFVTTVEIWDRSYGSIEKALLHTSTFGSPGGNPRAAAAAITAINVIYEENLIETAYEMGRYLLPKLKELQEKYPLIKEVRGKGLLIGIEFHQKDSFLNKLTGGRLNELTHEYTGAMVAGDLLNKYRIITVNTLNNPNVIRLEPPLNVSKQQIDYVVDSLDKIFTANASVWNLAVSSTKNLVGSIFKS